LKYRIKEISDFWDKFCLIFAVVVTPYMFWGKRLRENVKGEWRSAIEEVMQLADEMGVLVMETNEDEVKEGPKEKKKVEKKEVEKKEDEKWDIVFNEEKTAVTEVTNEEWKDIKEAREKNGKWDPIRHWVFPLFDFNEMETKTVELTEEEWKVVKEAREKTDNEIYLNDLKKHWFLPNFKITAFISSG